jgi:hypothetical protein
MNNIRVSVNTELIICNDEWWLSCVSYCSQRFVQFTHISPFYSWLLWVTTHNGATSHLHSVSLWIRFISFYEMCNFECLVFFEATYHVTLFWMVKKNRSPKNENKSQKIFIFFLTGIIILRYIFSCLQAFLLKFYTHFSFHSWVSYATPVIFTFIWSL